jgi:hypothetical protein
VNLDEATGRYLAAGEDLDGLVLTRPVGRGELLPVAAVGRRTPQRGVGSYRGRPVRVAGWTRAGWSTSTRCPRPQRRAAGPAELVLDGVTIGEDVKSGGSAFGGSGSKAGVSLLVDSADVPDLIDAVATATSTWCRCRRRRGASGS